MGGHETLKAWLFPPDEWRLADQLRRAADSVALNIAEGSGRGTNKEFRKFLEAARGSMKEVETGRTLAFDGDLVGAQDRVQIEGLVVETARTLYGLLRFVNDCIERGEVNRRHRKVRGEEPPA